LKEFLMADSDPFVIVGGGLAGAKAAEALRDQGFAGRVVLVGREAYRPYERPPLSKGYLAGSAERESVFVHTPEWYAEHDVELLANQEVTSIDPARHRIQLADRELGYRKLLLATGSTPRRLPIAGSEAEGVFYLRTLDDSDRLRELLSSAGRLAVIGAGWIGLEVTAAARQAGVEVTVFEAADLPLLRVLGPELAEVFAQLHRAHDVDLRMGVQISEILTAGGTDRRATGVQLADGSAVGADAVLVGVGAAPNDELAATAGLAVDNGVLVDDTLQTSDPDIVAAGDVANAYHPILRRRVRVEHWANALKQPAFAAATMRGEPRSYQELPYFYTDQYDLGMEYIGYAEPGDYDRVVIRGDLDSREFIAFWLDDGRVVAGMNVNVWDVVEQIKALILSGKPVDPAHLADTARSLESLLPG
jgi:3-phenylpropionate/trans-cinnamate dioxygenase ferredoxin reductase component